MDFASLRRTTPLSRTFSAAIAAVRSIGTTSKGFAHRADDVRGRVLEFCDDAYTRRFGGDRVTRSDVLYPQPGHPGATIVDDLARPAALAGHAFDCIVCTQALMYVYDVHAAVRSLHRALAPRGTLLATFPGISQISAHDLERFGEFWRFTRASATRLFGDVFGVSNVAVESHGNVLAATGFLYGLTVEEFELRELDVRDPQYEVTITVRASRAPRVSGT